MRNLLVLAGIALTVLGLVLLARGVGELVNIGSGSCTGANCIDDADLFISFAAGIALLTIGPIIWSAGAQSIRNSGSPNVLGRLGFLGIFGLSFAGVGAVMLIQSVQPNAENPGGVLTILGVVFGLVGLGSLGVEAWLQLAARNLAKLRATGLHGRGIVTGVHDTGITVNLDPVVKVDIRVELPGVTPYPISVRHTVSRLSVGAVAPGLAVAVLADPARPGRVTVDWDAPIELAGDGRGASSASLAPGPAAALASLVATLNAAAAASDSRSGGSNAAAGIGSPLDHGATISVEGGALSPELLRTVTEALAAAAATGDFSDLPVTTIDARGLSRAAHGPQIAGPGVSVPGVGQASGAVSTPGGPGPGPTGDALPARVQIDSMQDTGVDMGGSRLFAFDLTVSVSGRQPYQTTYAGSVPMNLVPRLSRGASFPAIVDPERPGEPTIEWAR